MLMTSEAKAESTSAVDMNASANIKVTIIEDERDIRECLSFLINGTEGFECIGSFRTMEEALDRIPHELPNVVLSDIGLPGMDGIEGIHILKEKCPDLLILMLTVYDDDERIFDAMCAGASGYLLKKTPPAKLLDSLKEAVAGGAPRSEEHTSELQSRVDLVCRLLLEKKNT